MYWATRNAAAKTVPDIRNAVALPELKLTLRNRCIGSIGWLARSSHATNPAISKTPVTSVPMVVDACHPSSPARIRPQTMAAAPLATSVVATRSSLVAGPLLS
jgi:hypothetical protein